MGLFKKVKDFVDDHKVYGDANGDKTKGSYTKKEVRERLAREAKEAKEWKSKYGDEWPPDPKDWWKY